MWLTQTGVKTESEIGTERFCKRLTHKNETVSQVGAKTVLDAGIVSCCKEL